MLVPSTLCPFPQRGRGGGCYSSGGVPVEPRAAAQAAVSISESRGRGQRGTQASQKYNRSRRKSISQHPLPHRRHLQWGSASAAVCARGGVVCPPQPRNKHTDLGQRCLHYRCTFYLLALSLTGPAALHLDSTQEKSKGWMLLCLFR